MRIASYISTAVALVIFFAIVLFVAGVLVAVMSGAGIPTAIPRDLIVYTMYLAAGGFIAIVIFDYVYRLIEGEEE